MMRKFFGTDGIRGLTNSEPMTARTALCVGQAAGTHFMRGDHRHRVVIGKDTRLSGYMMESALVAGFTSVGMDVVLLGPMPTPAVAMVAPQEVRARCHADRECHLRGHRLAVGEAADPVRAEEFACHCQRFSAFSRSSARSRQEPGAPMSQSGTATCRRLRRPHRDWRFLG